MKLLKSFNFIIKIFAIISLIMQIAMSIREEEYKLTFAWSIALSWCVACFVFEFLNDKIHGNYDEIVDLQHDLILKQQKTISTLFKQGIKEEFKKQEVVRKPRKPRISKKK